MYVRTYACFIIIEWESAPNDAMSVEGSPILGDKYELKQLDCKEKMTYTEQAAKRTHCQRLTR